MKCAGCQQEFPNLNALTKHKPTCQGLNGDTPVCNNTNEVQVNLNDGLNAWEPLEQTGNEEFIIPIGLCPEEVNLYAEGHTVGLRVTGILTPDGVKIQEVLLIR